MFKHSHADSTTSSDESANLEHAARPQSRPACAGACLCHLLCYFRTAVGHSGEQGPKCTPAQYRQYMTVAERESVKWLGTSIPPSLILRNGRSLWGSAAFCFWFGGSGEVGKPGASHVQPCPKDCLLRLGALSLVRLSRTGFAPPVLQLFISGRVGRMP